MTATIIDLFTRREIQPAAARAKRKAKSAAPDEELTIPKPGDRPALRNARKELAAAIAAQANRDASGTPTSWMEVMRDSMLHMRVWQMEEYGPGYYTDDPKPGLARGE